MSRRPSGEGGGWRRRWPQAVLGGLVCATTAATVAACGRPEPDPMAAYCDAIAKPSIQLDSAALIEGDETALEDAHTLYAEIAALAPADMAAPWQVVQKELDSMLKAARGDIAVADVDYQGFNEAVVTIESDRRERCD